MRRITWTIGTTLALAALLASVARADEPANSLAVMFAHVNLCMATVRLAPGTDVTVQFSLNRRGGLIGKPRITHAHWEGDDRDRRAAAVSIADGFDRCLPVAISDSLGGAIAGRLIAYRMRGRPADART